VALRHAPAGEGKKADSGALFIDIATLELAENAHYLKRQPAEVCITRLVELPAVRKGTLEPGGSQLSAHVPPHLLTNVLLGHGCP
jgi:hypothetical protein